ncbi:helix-turn-helix domain-containing protein [Neobacillus vireti]|uniref:Transcriptional regulator n=1 Tax=Neobacillus vireti LMG 21834 TaxID=1131730 RepID=A0AB94IS66_9BACI|nr:MerR family transcriptional regulator [Neobacillus vireti]ETI69817.1 transcriptional regulator [Neobacillus vireti LMG 21834]
MKISEVMRETNLTKKAIYYYEEEGLITPWKDSENGYRTYSEEDVKKLNIIYGLRKLDFSLKDIQAILSQGKNTKEIINKQLDSINNEITCLLKNKAVLERLSQKDSESIIGEFKSVIADLDKESKNIAGYMLKELNRVLPGNLGKMFAIQYGQFLDEPLDSPEKELAWQNMIYMLDSLEEINYPDDIKDIINEKFERLTDDDLEKFKEKFISETNKILARTEGPSKEEQDEIRKRIEEVEKNPAFQKEKELQQFMINHLKPIFHDVNKYMYILSSRFEKFNQLMREILSN